MYTIKFLGPGHANCIKVEALVHEAVNVLAFMTAVVGFSLPELIIIRRVLKPQLIAVFVGTVAIDIILTGYLFNLIFLI